VYSLTPPASPGGAWTESVLYSFTGTPDGAGPTGLTLGKGGVLYGITVVGGASGNGTVFSLTPPASPGGAWTESLLYTFTGTSGDGAAPMGLTAGEGGVLYGTTYTGGLPACPFAPPDNSCGTVFSLTPPSSAGGAWTETVLHDFMYTDGAFPTRGVVIGNASGRTVLFGTTDITPFCYGTAFALEP